MSKLWPVLANVRLTFRMLDELSYLNERESVVLMRLVKFAAAQQVWTYTPPSEDGLPDDDRVLSRLAMISLRRWKSVRKSVEPFFDIGGGFWKLNRDWVRIETEGRSALPARTLEVVAAREGVVCAYCGTRDGPFEYDHIFPLSRGGSDEPNNLVIACAPCNRSKGAKTLLEWMESRP